MKYTITLLLLLATLIPLHAANSTDPFTPYLDGKPPQITREILTPLAALCASDVPALAGKPNIIFIMSDDCAKDRIMSEVRG
jgi:hypothetical protein